ncbi:MAG: TRAP transporter substrate-binding protein [Amphritea sp.]
MKKIVLSFMLTVAAVLSAQAPAYAAEVTLRFSHFLPAVAGQHTKIIQVWADKVAKESNGRIAVEIYPAATLAKAPKQYEAVENRIADVAFVIQGYTANRFPLTQVVELPGVVQTATQGSCVLQSLYDEGLVASEYKQTKPLFLFTHGQGLIHSKDKTIKSPKDLGGLRIRRPTAVVGKLLEGLGAQPVGMPAPGVYQSLQRGVIDGVAMPWQAAKVFRLNELDKTHTEVGGLYSLAFAVTMNKDVYDSLPDDLQKVIDNNSGAEWSRIAGQVYDDLDVKGRAEAVAAGHEIITIDSNDPAWKPILNKASEGYLAELEARGLPARKVYARALELSKTCS